MIIYNGMPVLWYTGLQKTTSSQWFAGQELSEIARSSANAESIAASDGLVRGLHLTYVCEELHIDVPRPITIDIDASAAIGFLNNTGSGGKMKHIDIRESWVQQLRDREHYGLALRSSCHKDFNSEIGLFSDGRLSRLPPLNPVTNLPRVFAGRRVGLSSWHHAVSLDTTSTTGFKPENASAELFRSARTRSA